MDEALNCELEALQETFDVSVTQHHDGLHSISHSISMKLQPYTGDEDTFVETVLNFSLDQMYPETVPTFWFDTKESKGLSDERLQTLRKATAEGAEEFPGEPVLMMMCMAAKDTLSSMNFPEGPCPFCLEPMHCAAACLRGPCFHGYHIDCFRCWWLWLIQKHHNEVLEYERSRSSNNVGLGCVQKEDWDLRSVGCPVCRVLVPHDLLQRALPPEEATAGHPNPAIYEAWHQCGDSKVVTLPDTQAPQIDEDLRHAIHQQQEDRLRVERVQEQCGGLVQKSSLR